MLDYQKDFYQNNGQNDDRIMLWFYSRYAKKFLKNKYNSSILDYGCGTGHLLKRFKKHKTYGFDISDYAIKTAKQISPKTQFVSSLNAISNYSLDMIISLHCLEHIEKPEIILKEFYHKLTEDCGIVLFVVPVKSGIGYRLKKEKWFAFTDKTHISLFDEEKWFEMAKNAGFEIVSAKTDGPWNPPYIKYIPLILQKLFCYSLCAMQILIGGGGKMFIPRKYGEDLILVIKKVKQ